VTHLPVNRSAVTRGLILARQFAQSTALAPQAGDHLALIVEEWLNNVIEHSDAPSNGRIIVTLRRVPGQILIVITDGGIAFDPRAVSFKGPNTVRGGGAGLALIRAWCRIADYRRFRGRNRVVFEMTTS
jgi:serine/threonine-protein kinase RsbW